MKTFSYSIVAMLLVLYIIGVLIFFIFSYYFTGFSYMAILYGILLIGPAAYALYSIFKSASTEEDGEQT